MDDLAAWAGPGPEPSWWRTPIAQMTSTEYSDFVRACAHALKGLGDRVTVTIATRGRKT
jgi:hypothetical protein